VLHGHVLLLFGKDELVYKFITLFFPIKNTLWNVLLGIQKIGQKWYTLACKYPSLDRRTFGSKVCGAFQSGYA